MGRFVTRPPVAAPRIAVDGVRDGTGVTPARSSMAGGARRRRRDRPRRPPRREGPRPPPGPDDADAAGDHHRDGGFVAPQVSVYNRARDVVLQRDHGGGVAMGWERDGIGLSSTWRVDDDAIGAWIAAETVRDGLLAPLRAEGLLAHVTHLWIADGKPRPIGSAAQLDKLVGGWRA